MVIVQGEKDRSVPVAKARRLAQALPNARLHLIPNTGHELMFFQADAISRLLQTLPRSPR